MLAGVDGDEGGAAATGGVRAVVGEDAKARAVEFPARMISRGKRRMGRSIEDVGADLA